MKHPEGQLDDKREAEVQYGPLYPHLPHLNATLGLPGESHSESKSAFVFLLNRILTWWVLWPKMLWEVPNCYHFTSFMLSTKDHFDYNYLAPIDLQSFFHGKPLPVLVFIWVQRFKPGFPERPARTLCG